VFWRYSYFFTKIKYFREANWTAQACVLETFQKSKGKIMIFNVGSFSCLARGSLLGVFWVLFGKLLDHLWQTLGAFGAPLGRLWVLWVLVGCLFWYFSLLLGALGHSVVPLCPFVSP